MSLYPNEEVSRVVDMIILYLSWTVDITPLTGEVEVRGTSPDQGEDDGGLPAGRGEPGGRGALPVSRGSSGASSGGPSARRVCYSRVRGRRRA